MTKWRTAVLSGLTLGLAVPLVGACSSSTAHASAPATESTCQQVSAVLSDGPDPDADPVGGVRVSVTERENAKESVVVASNKLNSICPGAAS